MFLQMEMARHSAIYNSIVNSLTAKARSPFMLQVKRSTDPSKLFQLAMVMEALEQYSIASDTNFSASPICSSCQQGWQETESTGTALVLGTNLFGPQPDQFISRMEKMQE